MSWISARLRIPEALKQGQGRRHSILVHKPTLPVWPVAGWILELKTPAVLCLVLVEKRSLSGATYKCHAHDDLAGRDSSLPGEVQVHIDLGHIRVRGNIGTDEFGVFIPCSMYCIARQFIFTF